MLLRFAYLSVTNVFTLLRLLPVSDRDKNVEILVLRYQITVLQRQLGTTGLRLLPSDRAFLAALLHRLPRDVLGWFRLLVRSETVLRWHRNLLARRHAARSRPGRPGRDGKYPRLFDTVLKDAGVTVVLSGIHMPRMNVVMERWIQTCRRELLDRTLIWNQRHLLHALSEFAQFYNCDRPHQGIANAQPLRALLLPIPPTSADACLRVHRRDRLGGILHEYQHAALPA